MVSGIVALSGSTAVAAPTDVTGTVFRDFNSNGQKDTAGGLGVAVDTGIAGVTVTAFDRSGANVGSTTSAASGNYTLAISGQESNDLRVEFTNLPAGYESTFHGTAGGTRNKSSVQFVQAGATGVNFGANVPEDYSQSNAPLITPIQSAGQASSAALVNQPAIVATPWSAGFSTAGAQGTTLPNRTTLATVPQVGSIWGTAFQGSTNSLYAAATYKRHSGLGPGGLAEIYRISGVLGSDGNITSGTPTVSQWLNLQGKAIVGGGTVDLGTAQSDAARGITTPTAPALDLDAFQKAGKIGIGGLAISADQKTLYFVNLFDRNLYSVDISDPVAASTSPVIKRLSLGLTGAQRPWAVETYRGNIYVGYVDSGEDLATPTSAAAAGMKAHIIRASEATPTVWSSDLLNFSLGYNKGTSTSNGSPSDPTNLSRWNSWTDAWSWGSGPGKTVAITWYTDPGHVYPQPILSNLYFDAGGYLSLGFLDRTSVQGGNRNHSIVPGDNTSYQTVANGDLIIASPSAGGFAVENNGTVGTRGPSATSANAEGPGTGEFYNDRNGLGVGTDHRENTLGGLAGIAGVSEIATTSYDPLNQVRVAGVSWLSTANGAATRGYNQTLDAGGVANTDGTFQKGGGLGDIQALSDVAPLQIGNRVWLDGDQDGIQDADEPAIAGVTVNLVQGGTVIASRVTDSNGEYYFSSTDADLAGEFEPNGGNYTVQFVKPTTGSVNIGSDTRFGTVAWSDVTFTTHDAGTNRAIDSNAIVNVSDTTKGEFTFAAGSYGENDDTIDAGFAANGTLHVIKAIDPSGGISPGGATYALTLDATDFRGDVLSVGADAAFSIGVGAGNAHDVTLPVGSFATVGESPNPTVRSWSVSPSSAAKITGTGASATIVTVTNTLYEPGTFSVSKTVTGDAASLVAPGAPFTVEYTYAALAGVWKSMVVLRDGSAVTSDPIPYNTSVTIREVAPTTPTTVVWGTPVWTVNSIATTAPTTTITIGDGTNVSVALNNPANVQRGDFSVTKNVTGSAAASVPNGFTFDVAYSYTDQAGTAQSGTLHLTKTGVGQTQSVTNLPVGAVVTLSEATPTGAPADVSWGTPVWSATGGALTDNGDGTVSFTIGSTAVAVSLTNPTTRIYGAVRVTKDVTGSASATVPDNFDFTVNYSYTDATGSHAQSAVVSKASPTVDLSNVPLGATVTFSEGPRIGAPANVSWQTPKWTASGAAITDHNDGTATLVVSTASLISIGLENPTVELLGGFSLVKAVTGSAAASVPDNFAFTINYSYPGQVSPQSVTVTKANPNASVSTLPLGTVVTLSEVAPTGAPADVSWNAPVWSATGGTLTDNGDGTVSFTVGASTIAVVLTNPTTQLYGSFSITKTVTGPAASVLTPGHVFSGTYTYPGQATPGTFSLQNGQTWTPPGSELIPAGTIVTVSETQPTGGLPALTGWGTPVFLVSGTPIGSAGSGTFTIGAGTSIAVALQNPTTVTPVVTIQKGDGTGTTIDNEADTMVDAEYYLPGETKTIVFRVTNNGTEDLRNVHLTDHSLSGASVQALTWTFPDGSTTAGTLSGADWSADWSATFGGGGTVWVPGAVITGSATLTVEGADAPHVDTARVDAVGVTSGTAVHATNNYNAYTASIQIIHYDGNRADPAVKDSLGNWIIPTNPLVDPQQDANDPTHAVKYPAGQPQRVRWVITNVGTTFLTDLTMVQTANVGPQYGPWTCDMTPIGGTQTAFSFAGSAVWHGIFAPGQSFFCDGPLTLDALEIHQDVTQVLGTVVVPEVDGAGMPTDLPTLSLAGDPVIFTLDDGTPRRVSDSDPFNARAVLKTLAFTGVNQGTVAALVWLALGGVLMGLVLLVVPRRRRRAAHLA